MNARIAQGFSLDFRHIYCEEMDLCAFNVDHYDSCTYVLPWKIPILLLSLAIVAPISQSPYARLHLSCSNFGLLKMYKLLVSLFIPFLASL